MVDALEHPDRSEIEAFIGRLPFVREYAIRVAAAVPGEVTIELPFDDRFSGPPGQFPASMVGTAGDVAAVSSCLSLVPRGWAVATLDFTVKMTGVARGREAPRKRAGAASRQDQLGRRSRHLHRVGGRGSPLRNRAGDDPQFSDQMIAPAQNGSPT